MAAVIGFSFKERFLRFQLLFPDFHHLHHVIWRMKWAKKLKTKNGQNMSSGPFSHDAAHLFTYLFIHEKSSVLVKQDDRKSGCCYSCVDHTQGVDHERRLCSGSKNRMCNRLKDMHVSTKDHENCTRTTKNTCDA